MGPRLGPAKAQQPSQPSAAQQTASLQPQLEDVEDGDEPAAAEQAGSDSGEEVNPRTLAMYERSRCRRPCLLMAWCSRMSSLELRCGSAVCSIPQALLQTGVCSLRSA